MQEYKYIVWVGGVDDYYTNYNDAKRDADEWKADGYDDVIIEKIKKDKKSVDFLGSNDYNINISAKGDTI